jgi:hypothetical protein
MSNETKRPAAQTRKAVVPTQTWGEVVVWNMKLSERLGVTDIPEVEGEAPEARAKRVGALFTSRLLGQTVHHKDGTLLYPADEWDIWLGTHADELEPVVLKSMELNGFKTGGADGESAAKNG